MAAEVVGIDFEFRLKFRDSRGKSRVAVTTHIGQSEKVMSLLQLRISGNCFLDLLYRLLVELPFPVCPAQVHMDLGGVSQTSDHLVEQQSRPVQVIKLEISDAQQVSVLKGRTRDHSSLQVLPRGLVVALLEKYPSERILGRGAVRRP